MGALPLAFGFWETTGGVGLGGRCTGREFADAVEGGVAAAAEVEGGIETETGGAVGTDGGCGLDFAILTIGVGRGLTLGSGLGSGFVSGISPSLSSSSCLTAPWCA